MSRGDAGGSGALGAAISLALVLATPAGAVERLSWLADCWAHDGGEAGSGETWTPAEGGTMFGVGRTVRGGRTASFEFMQVRSRDDGTLVFVAQPGGAPPVEFPLASLDGTRAVFENPANEFPQRVIYERRDGGVLHARIEGGGPAVDFPMHRVACDARDTYDPHLAAEIGADDYGMHRYVVAFLKAGPNRGHSKDEAAALMHAHLDNIQRLADAGKLVVAGPFIGDGPLRGIYVFDVETLDEARELTATDPAIQAGRLEMELHAWYGAAALKQLLDLYPRTTKESP